jgi:hypothetical protein
MLSGRRSYILAPLQLAVGTMPQFQCEGTGYVLQADVDAFIEACQCRNQRKTYEPKPVTTVAS